MQHYWLFKSEPNCFSIDDLRHRPNQTTHWDGVRNYQVRNLLRDTIKKGDQAFFYHSSCNQPGIVGTIAVVSGGYPDFTAWDRHAEHYDPKSSAENPRWFMVDVKLMQKFSHIVTLQELKHHPDLQSMRVTQKGNRLSITPVTSKEWQLIVSISHD